MSTRFLMRETTRLVLVLGITWTGACKPRQDYSKSLEQGGEYEGGEKADTSLGNCGKVDLTRYTESGYSLTSGEISAIKKYTSEDVAEGKKFYRLINDGLRNMESSTLTRYCSFIKTLSSAVNKLKKQNGSCTATRYLDLPYSVVQKMNRKGQLYSDRGFFSSTLKGTPPAGFGGKTDVIHIEADNCPEVTSYSSIPSEREALWPPGTDFVVVRDAQVSVSGGTYYNKFWLKVTTSGGPVVGNPNPNVGNLGHYNNNNILAGGNNGPQGSDRYKVFINKLYSGTDNQGKVRAVKFLADRKAKYTGASGNTQDATWQYSNPDSITIRLSSGTNYYKVVTNEKICFLTGAGGSVVSCLVQDDGDGPGNGPAIQPIAPPDHGGPNGPAIQPVAPPDHGGPNGPAIQPVQPAGNLSHHNFIGAKFVGTDSQGVTRSVTFQANQLVISVGGSGNSRQGRWTFVSPNRIRLDFNNEQVWYQAQSAERICFVKGNAVTSSCMDKG